MEEGLAVSLYSDDADELGTPDELRVAGFAQYSSEEGYGSRPSIGMRYTTLPTKPKPHLRTRFRSELWGRVMVFLNKNSVVRVYYLIPFVNAIPHT